MRQVFAIAFLCSTVFADQRIQKSPVTLVLQFEGQQSPAAVASMKQEVTTLLKDAGTRIDFRLPDERGFLDEPGNLVVVKFRGNCRMSNTAPLYDERGPLAFTHTADGQVLSFSEVECDRVTRSVRSALFGGDHDHADELLGRALGRVVAHELYHILGNTAGHASNGFAKKSLSGAQLIQDTK
jgi:hypothetical protein